MIQANTLDLDRRQQRREIVRPIGADAPEVTARFRDPAGNLLGLYQLPA